MSELAEQIAAQHVAKSLNEMRDAAKRERWLNGDRAKEQAAEIVATILAAATERLEGKETEQ